MSTKSKLLNLIISLLLMSLAWPLRGQFGHLPGAMITGTAAALVPLIGFRGRWLASAGLAILENCPSKPREQQIWTYRSGEAGDWKEPAKQRVEPPIVEDGVASVISPTRVASTDPFLFHKTTRRELYDREWQHYNETLGADEVLYLNERGELAEGSRTTIFVERDGRLLTPPLASGLLPGTLRAELLATGRAHEAVLTRADLEQADVAYLGNSVRGLLRAEPLRSHAAEATGALGSAP